MFIKKTIHIPDDVDADVTGDKITVSGPKGKLERKLTYPHISIKKTNSEIEISTNTGRKRQISMIGTFTSHIQNMITGVTQGFEYKLRAVYSHFPIRIEVEHPGVMIYNFMGEHKPRKAKIVGSCDVKVNGDEITVRGIDKEAVGQTAANLEIATRTRGKDPKIFQDGIYMLKS